MPTIGQADVKITADARGFARDAERAINRELRDVNVDRGGRGFGRRVTEVLTNETRRGFGQAALAGLQQFGIVLQGGISPSSAGAFGAIVLAAIVPAVTIAGALAGGALILAFGSAIAGIGIIAAAQNEEVKDAFSDMAEDVGNEIKEIAKPFEPVLIGIADLVRRVVDTFSPILAQAFEDLAPAISQFSEFLAQAFESLAPVIQPVTDAFIELLEDLGPELANDVFPDLADAIIKLAEAVSDNSDTITDIITWFLSAGEAIINFIADLVNLAGWFADNPKAVAAGLLIIAGAFAFLATVVTGPVGVIALIIAAITTLAIFISTFRDEIREVLGNIGRWFQDLWKRVVDVVKVAVARLGENVRTLVSNVTRFFTGLRDAVRIRVDAIGKFFSDLGRKVKDAFNGIVSFIRGIPGKIASAARGMWDGIWNAFKGMINGIIRGWNNLEFRTGSIDTPFGSIGPFTLGTPNIPYLANGGMITQAGAAIVGDAGPELLTLPRGARVDPLTGNGGLAGPEEFEAVAFIDLGEGIQERLDLTFRKMRRGALSGSGRQVGRAFA